MLNKFRKNIIVPAVCLSILASAPASAFAAKFDDSEIHWAKDAIEVWSDHEVIQGFDGMFRPDDTITRAEMAVMINRIMNYQETAENTFEDLPDSWYTDAILKLVKQGILVGSDNHIRPEDPVTREESIVMLARALGIEGSNTKAGSLSDLDQISDWALETVQAMVEKGLINGYEDGTFRPQESMTRACSVTVINNTIKGFYNKPGTYQAEEAIDGLVIVNTADVVLEGMQINGDLILTPGVKDGTITLKGTTVSGNQTIMGGNIESTTPDASPSTPPTATPAPTSNPGGGSGSGGGGSTIQTASSTDIIVNSSYADQTGTFTYNRKRYTMGKNAFSSLEDAIAQAKSLNKKSSITLLSDFTFENTIALDFNDLTLKGGGHTLTFSNGVKDGIQIINAQGMQLNDLSVQMQDETGKWNGSYGIQAYQSTVTLKDVSATGADAGILVNSSEVTLDGIVDVSGNEFGGIEVSKGAEATALPKLKGSLENLKNDTELTSGKPTIWIDKVSELTEAVVEITGLTAVSKDNDQMYYYLGQDPESITAKVTNLDELEAALLNPEIQMILVANDIVSDKTLEITKSVIMQGTDSLKTISFENKNGFQIVNAGAVTMENISVQVTGDLEGWQGIYALQAYGASEVVLKNVSATGADAGILVNGAQVKLDGVVDVSGNEFGGIEVSKGVDVATNPKLTGTSANLKNDTEASSKKPTVWIDKVSELTTSVVDVSGLNEAAAEKDQMYYFIGEVPVGPVAEVATLEELEKALAHPDVTQINITADIESDKTLQITKEVTIKGLDGLKTISFENKNGFQIVNAGAVTMEDIKAQVTGDTTGWQGIYALQAYGTSDVVLKNVSATGADAGILVNGAQVTLDGVVDVSGNEFGGIEVSKGVDVATNPVLNGTSANLKNDTEASSKKPTIWIDKVSELTTSVVTVSGLNEHDAGNDQMYYYLGEVPSDII